MTPLLLVVAAVSAPPDRATEAYFETHVRPLFAEHCARCHSGDKAKGGVRLDTPQGLFEDTGEGHLIKRGDPDGSRLVRSVRWGDDYAMPPKGQLPTEDVKRIEEWVRRGAAWPAPTDDKPAAKHWAFESVVNPPVPPGPADLGPVDRFLRAKQTAAGLSFAPRADPRVLLKRVHYDLTGLPPTAAELSAFAADPSPENLARVVDALLASPAFGERWGRHWLDVARYADSREAGFQVDTRYPFAWTYRDWVIDAFNRDVPFDRFVVRQIAADHATADPTDPDLAALGFLAVGRRFSPAAEGNVNDIIDDQLDVIGRGLMGLSIGCARCHDHKFDPIPIKDYYSLYGVLAGVQFEDRPIAGSNAERAAIAAFDAEMVRRRQKYEDYVLDQHGVMFPGSTTAAGYAASLMAWHKAKDDKDVPLPEGAAKTSLEERRFGYLKAYAKQKSHPVFGPFFAFEKLADEGFAAKSADTLKAEVGDDRPWNSLVDSLFRDKPAPKSLAEVADRYGRLFSDVDARWRTQLGGPRDKGVPFTGFADPAADGVLDILVGEDGLGYVPADECHFVFDGEQRDKYLALKKAMADLKLEPTAPPHAMAVADPDDPVDPYVFIRGKPGSQGMAVPRRFLAVATVGEPEPFPRGTGRLDLAEAIVDPANPLTARVWVNRVWGHLFGEGIVRTPSDFGTRGDPPTHPALLDHLAGEFVRDGWSTKRLVRTLVLSRAYAQASDSRPDGVAADPENKLLWRANRRRLDLEGLRDGMLAVAGVLDRTAGGRSIDLSADPTNHRRTVYAKVDRVALSTLHRAFDFANPDLHTPSRFVTTVPQQTVLLLNHPFAADAARQLAARVDTGTDSSDPAAWVDTAYHTALGRAPTIEESTAAVRFLTKSKTPLPPVSRPVYWVYGTANWDNDTRRLSGFAPLTEFAGDSWVEAGRAADKAGKLTAFGGRTAADANRVLVRRWVAPTGGSVRLDGRFAPEQDGATAVAVGSKVGVVGTWTGKDDGLTTVPAVKVVAGETLDFFVVPADGDKPAGFDWRFTVAAVDSPKMGKMVWNSAGHFDGPAPPAVAPLTPKQQLAQVLLLSNEFATLD